MSDASPYRAAEKHSRPRLWIPGLLFVEIAPRSEGSPSSGQLRLGPRAGRWWSREDVRDWKREVHLVEKAKLGRAAAERVGVLLPEAHLDPERCPSLHQVAREAALVWVDEAQVALLLEEGLRVYTVGFERRVDDMFWISGDGGDDPPFRVCAPYQDLIRGALKPDKERSRDDDPEAHERALGAIRRSGFLDRILRATTGGLVDEFTLNEALTLRTLVEEPVYVGPGQPLRMRRRTADEIVHVARGLEAQYRQVVARAEGMREEGEAIVRALAEAGARASTVQIPVYVEARRERFPALKIRLPEEPPPESEISAPDARGNLQPWLSLPAQEVWSVDEVEPWWPELPADVVEEQRRLAEKNARRWQRERALTKWGCALAVIVPILALLLVVARGCAR